MMKSADQNDHSPLDEQEAELRSRRRRNQELLERSVRLSGEPTEIFDHVVRLIGQLFGVAVVCLSQIEGDTLRFRSAYIKGEVLSEPGQSPLEGTPCATVLNAKDVVTWDRVAERFPGATFLRDHNADAYCGIPALDGGGNVVAVICLLDSKPRHFTEDEQHSLFILGQRVALELERDAMNAMRQAAEKAHRESEERRQLLLDSIPAYVSYVDADERYQLVNHYYESWYRRPRQEIVGKTVRELQGRENYSRMEPHLREALSGKSIHYVQALRDKDGHEQVFETRYIPHRTSEGNVAGFFVLVFDVTSERLALEAIQESEHRYRTLFDACPDAVFIMDLEGKIRSANPAAARLHGYSLDELLSMNIHDLNTPEHARAAPERVERLMRGESLSFEVTHFRKDGTAFPVDAIAVPMRIGDELRILGFDRDVTARKQFEEQLRLSEERLKLATSASRQGLWDWNLVTGEVWLNPEFLDLLGYRAGEIEASLSTFLNLLHPDDSGPVLSNLESHLLGGNEVSSSEYRLRSKSGEYVWLRGAARVVKRADDGAPMRMTGVLYDISQRKQAEEQMALLRDELTHMARLGVMGEMAAGMAHELNQPLAAIHMYANAASELARRGETTLLRDTLNHIEQISLRAGEIIRRMRGFSRRDNSHRESFAVNVLIGEVLRMLESDLRHNRIKLNVSLDENLRPMFVDGIQIQQVLVNLIRNAIDAMIETAGQRILSIQTRQLETVVRVSVSDTGCGIAPAIASRLFHPFQSTKKSGLGLGLPICRTLVESHGGKIEVESDHPDGTTFVFTLPMALAEV